MGAGTETKVEARAAVGFRQWLKPEPELSRGSGLELQLGLELDPRFDEVFEACGSSLGSGLCLLLWLGLNRYCGLL